MPRRRHDDGATVESDSFLDIVANIVGILIILIVVAGVRVGQTAALPVAEPAPAEAAVTEPVVVPAPPERPKLEPVIAPRPTIVRLPAPEPLAPPLPSPTLIAAIDDAVSDLERLKAEQASLILLADELQDTSSKLQAQAIDVTEATSAIEQQLGEVETFGEALLGQIDQLQSALDGVGRQISDVPGERVTVLRHRLNPIGREVQGTELHFRIEGSRVARVPIAELIEQLKPQVERQKDWISKFQRHQGRLGPVDGFSMEYLLERQRLSVIEELRLGAQMMRISVTGWKVVPERDLATESVEEALNADSRFMSALRLVDRNATLTFWVYPDSFSAFRRLQEAVHEQGLAVAARPLPHGVPIAGSPNGSRSSSQ